MLANHTLGGFGRLRGLVLKPPASGLAQFFRVANDLLEVFDQLLIGFVGCHVVLFPVSVPSPIRLSQVSRAVGLP